MSSSSLTVGHRRRKPSVRWIVIAVAVVALLVAMALDTTVVEIGAEIGAGKDAFEPEQYGQSQFPKIQSAVEDQAVSAAKLAAAIQKDQSDAARKYGVPAGTGPEFSVKFTGVVGDGDSGIYRVKVDDVPDSLSIRVQTGPAINGTDLRDATGDIKFGDFTNQIQYQDAGAALNNAMKKQVLSTIDTSKLTGKTISVVGVFQLINPNGWLVTPVRLSVQ